LDYRKDAREQEEHDMDMMERISMVENPAETSKTGNNLDAHLPKSQRK